MYSIAAPPNPMKITTVVANSSPAIRPRKKSDFVIGFESRYCIVPDSLSSTMEVAPTSRANNGTKGKVNQHLLIECQHAVPWREHVDE